MSFGDDLSWGPIGGDLDERVQFFDAESPIPGGWDWLRESHEEFWRDASQPAENRLTWISSSCAYEAAAYLAYLQRFPDLPAAVVRPDQYVPPHPIYGPPLGTGTLGVEQMADVLDHAPRSDVADDEHLSCRWEELQREGALLRIVQNGELVSAPLDHYDRLLLACASPEWTRGVQIIGNALANAFEEQIWVSSDFLFSRLSNLIKSGTLEADRDVLGWTDEPRRAPAMVRKPG